VWVEAVVDRVARVGAGQRAASEGRRSGRRLRVLDGTRVRRWSSGLGAGATDKHAGLES
jgi:hypothetical protein